MKDFKYLPLMISVRDKPVLMVGQNPGKRGYSETKYVWDGDTRTTRLLRSITDECDNLIITNIVNYKDITEERLLEGLDNLEYIIKKYKPRKIICLGQYSYGYMKLFHLEVPIVKVHHPSYIVRFNKDKEQYRKELLGVLK